MPAELERRRPGPTARGCCRSRGRPTRPTFACSIQTLVIFVSCAEPAVQADAALVVPVTATDPAGAEDRDVRDLDVLVDVEPEVAFVRVVDAARVLRLDRASTAASTTCPRRGSWRSLMPDLVVLPRFSGSSVRIFFSCRHCPSGIQTQLITPFWSSVTAALDRVRVVDPVVRHRAVLRDRRTPGRLGQRRRDLLEIDQVDDVVRRRVAGVALQPELRARTGTTVQAAHVTRRRACARRRPACW